MTRESRRKEFDIHGGIEAIEEMVSKLAVSKNVVLVGIGGPSGAGKTHIARKIRGKCFSMDSYYFGADKVRDGNFDVPHSQDLELLRKHLIMLRENKPIEKPIYDFKIHKRVGYERFDPEPVVIIEGLYALNEILLDIIDVKVFVDSPSRTRWKRRVQRDMKERGRSKKSVISQIKESVEPMERIHVMPTRKYAEIIIYN